MTNRLSKEKSPYLQQHASNPVDWFPWGEQAFQLARETNRPIFLSIGYSSCHWCHVMAHECFENAEIADLMNKNFVNIKVDREERPDIDAIYMLAVQALTGSGGWPMSIWLTPELKPFYGGTYFPPEDRHGRPGFPSVIVQLAEIYKNDQNRIQSASQDLATALSQSQMSLTPSKDLPDIVPIIKSAYHTLKASYDSEMGGFGQAPKFPMPTYLDFLMYYFERTADIDALKMVSFTVKKMISGGLYDQLGGGFARYSTDASWLIPHFEKMLYDNSQLISTCSELFRFTGDLDFKNVVAESISYVLRDLKSENGAFFSAEDADSEGKEGAFYVWTLAEVKSVLTPELAEKAISYYGVTPNGNFYDPHTQELGKNVLVRTAPPPDDLEEIKQCLFEARTKRPRPFRDEKIITEWNSMMISALVKAGRIFNRKEWIEKAEQAARFLQKNLFDANTNRLYRRWCDGERAVEAQQIDYAMMIRAMIDLSEETKKHDWLLWALLLQETQDELFFDRENGGYFMADNRPDLLVRMKDEGDNVIPSGNSIAVWNGLKISALEKRPEFEERATQTLKFFADRLRRQPTSLTSMISALDFRCGSPRI